MKHKTVFLFIFCFFLFSADAYIPSYPMIVSHLAYFQGQGGYRIEQEITIKQGTEPVLLKETWWVQGAGQMRLDVQAVKKEQKDMYLRFIYKKNRKIFKDENNQIRNQSVPYYHLDRPFHLRSQKELKKLFSLWKVVPLPVLERKEGQGSDPFVRLSRKGGVIQYQIGQGKARLWLEQDEFVIRSWKWQQGGYLTAWDYKLYPRHLFFPSQRLFRHNSTEVFIRVIKTQSLKPDKHWVHKKQLSRKNTLSPSLSSSDQDRIREFYKKFR